MSKFEYFLILVIGLAGLVMVALPMPHERDATARLQNRVQRCWQVACKALKLRRD